MTTHARRTTVDGNAIAWCEIGDGQPLILLHGVGASHRTWRMVAPVLAKHFRVLMPDLPGHGLSERPDAPYTLPWYADAIAGWMDAIGVPKAHFIGHSFGGGVAQWMLIGHRSRIDRLGLLAAGGLGREVTAALRLVTTPLAAPVLESRFFSRVSHLAMRWVSRALDATEALELQQLARLNALPNSGLAFRRTVSGCIGVQGQRVQTWDHIHDVAALPPIALFWGDRDPILPVEHAHETARRLDNVTVTTYERCGHFVHLEAHERFANDAVGFLTAQERAPARLLPSTSIEDTARPSRLAQCAA